MSWLPLKEYQRHALDVLGDYCRAVRKNIHRGAASPQRAAFEVKQALIERRKVPADYVRICTGKIDELGDTDLMAESCPIRYIITVDKLRVGAAATIDLDGEALVTRQEGDVRLRQLELVGGGDEWDENELTRWLDAELHRGGSFQGLALAESQPWLRRVVGGLVSARGMQLPFIVRRRHSLAEVLRVKVADHGRRQVRDAMNLLIRAEPASILTSDEFAFSVAEQDYAPTELFEGHHFRKHAFTLVGAMNGEESECATRIDQHPNVARWLRNAERATQGGFHLPLAPGKFFADFIVELLDGGLVLVEYKMGKMANAPDELHKKEVGELWASRSGGRARFAWVAGKDWRALDEGLRD